MDFDAGGFEAGVLGERIFDEPGNEALAVAPASVKLSLLADFFVGNLVPFLDEGLDVGLVTLLRGDSLLPPSSSPIDVWLLVLRTFPVLRSPVSTLADEVGGRIFDSPVSTLAEARRFVPLLCLTIPLGDFTSDFSRRADGGRISPDFSRRIPYPLLLTSRFGLSPILGVPVFLSPRRVSEELSRDKGLLTSEPSRTRGGRLARKDVV